MKETAERSWRFDDSFGCDLTTDFFFTLSYDFLFLSQASLFLFTTHSLLIAFSTHCGLLLDLPGLALHSANIPTVWRLEPVWWIVELRVPLSFGSFEARLRVMGAWRVGLRLFGTILLERGY